MFCLMLKTGFLVTGPTTLDLAYVESEENKAKLRTPVSTDIKVFLLKNAACSSSFIDSYLEQLGSSGKGYFVAQKLRKNCIQYRCERNRKPRGQSTGQPDKTRANNCTAYVSFATQVNSSRPVCVVRSRLEHHPHHNLQDDAQDRVSVLAPALVDFIENELDSGHSAAQVLVASHKWANSQGHRTSSRRFFPALEDIWYIQSKKKQSGHMHVSDSLSVRSLVSKQLKNSILLYQELDRATDQAFMIVYQNDHQREILGSHGNIIFMDATYAGQFFFVLT